MYIRTLADLEAILKGWVSSFEKQREKFGAKLADLPMEAMRWSGSMFQEAPRHWIASSYLTDIEQRRIAEAGGTGVPTEAEMLEAIRSTAWQRMCDGARRVPSSSSDTSNKIDMYEMAAWAELLAAFGPAERN